MITRLINVAALMGLFFALGLGMYKVIAALGLATVLGINALVFVSIMLFSLTIKSWERKE